jgi:uncharacterized membrane protein
MLLSNHQATNQAPTTQNLENNQKVGSEPENQTSRLIEELKEVSAAAKKTALEAKVSIHNEWVHWIGLLVLVGIMVSAVAFLAVEKMTAGLRREAESLRLEMKDLRDQLKVERETLDQMRSETWEIQFFKKDGLRFILLKAGDRLESGEDESSAIRYVIGEGENKREAVKVLP